MRELLRRMPPGRLADLATGHGAFALTAHELGWEVTGVDARTTRMPMTDGIEWVEADVRDFPLDGYDVITVFGLLYHLELESQLDLLRRCPPALTLVDTHVSMRPTTMANGYLGHLFREVQEDPRASWGNRLSFWPTEESLCRMLLSAGFTSIHKVTPPPVTADRTLYIASASRNGDLGRVIEGFNAASEYDIVELISGIEVLGDAATGPTAGNVADLRQQRDAAVSALQKLRNRRSVRFALRTVDLVEPLYRRLRPLPARPDLED